MAVSQSETLEICKDFFQQLQDKGIDGPSTLIVAFTFAMIAGKVVGMSDNQVCDNIKRAAQMFPGIDEATEKIRRSK
jgi:hypothetical protein